MSNQSVSHQSVNWNSEISTAVAVHFLFCKEKNPLLFLSNCLYSSMSSKTISTPPSVSWAQRSARVFLTFNVECEKPDIKIEKKMISFKGICAPDRRMHEVQIPLYAAINPDKSAYVNKGRLIEVVLAKDNTGEAFWPSLTSDKKKYHWLKVDFNRWQDEDETEDELDDMNDMFSSKIGDFGDENVKNDTTSEDDEDLPDLE